MESFPSPESDYTEYVFYNLLMARTFSLNSFDVLHFKNGPEIVIVQSVVLIKQAGSSKKIYGLYVNFWANKKMQSILYCTIYLTSFITSLISIHLFSVDSNCYLGYHVILGKIISPSLV